MSRRVPHVSRAEPGLTSATGVSGLLTLSLTVALTLVVATLLGGCGGEAVSPPNKAVVSVTSLPERAEIFLDEVRTGTSTPDTLYVSPGTHRITLTLAGYSDSTFAFSAAESETLWFAVHLRAMAGTRRWVEALSVPATVYCIDFASSASFASLDYGLAVGEGGRVFRTTDGGLEWLERTSGFPEDLYGVSYPIPSMGWACGQNGRIVRTTNYGETWDSLPSGTRADLRGICFVDPVNGWTVGDSGKVLRTNDGGVSWTPQTSGTTRSLYAVFFLNTSLGWAVGGQELGGGQVIFRTSNGGLTWTESPAVSDACLYDVMFLSSTLGLCVGEGGLVLRSTDGGFSWSTVGNVLPLTLRSLAAWSAVDLWAVGGKSGVAGFVLKSGDAGLTWYAFEETPQPLFSVDAAMGVLSGWASGEGGLWGYR